MWLQLLAVALMVFVTAALSYGSTIAQWDIAIRDYSYEVRTDWAAIVARVLAYLGQGGALAGTVLAIASWKSVRLGTVRPLLMYLFACGLSGLVVLMKVLTGRVGPEWNPTDSDFPPFATLPESLLFAGLEPAQSYPAGHMYNVILWYGLIFAFMRMSPKRPAYWGIILSIACVVWASMTYLGWHWTSDGLVGIAAGFLALTITLRIDWKRMRIPTWMEPEPRAGRETARTHDRPTR